MKRTSAVFYPNLEGEIVKSGIPKRVIEEKLGLTHMTFTRRLNGESDFSVNDAKALCNMFPNMPFQELFATASVSSGEQQEETT